MERRALSSTKLSKVARTRTKSSITAITQDPLKRRRITRSMQRKMTTLDVNMKENTSASEGMMMINQVQESCVPRLFGHKQLACKENILEYNDGLGTSSSSSSSSSSSFVQLRPKQQQQQQLYQYAVDSYHHHHHHQQQQLEVHGDCISDQLPLDSLAPGNPHPGHANFHQSHYLSSSLLGFSGHAQSNRATTTTTTRQQQTHLCKLKIGQLMSIDSLDNGGNGVTTPLPHLQWVQSADLWRTMRSKDKTKAAPEAELHLHHPEILSNMRIILLDWMMEVCEEYKLHRETYYLAMDMFDRFMDARSNVQKSQLQLLGVTCLFIASKIEEIYPPKAGDFAYVTDGACSVSDLLDTELIVCKVLGWKLNHNMVTVNTWVNTYMQLGSHHFRPPGVKAKEFEFPAYSAVEFPKVMKLLDLCSLDITSRQFGSSVLAASAVYLQCERGKTNLSMITGFDVRDIQLCVNWMRPFAVILSQKPTLTKKSFPGVAPQDAHNIQTHDVSISMLEDSMEVRRSQEATPSQYTLLQDCSVMMTPPRNERRCLAPINTS